MSPSNHPESSNEVTLPLWLLSVLVGALLVSVSLYIDRNLCQIPMRILFSIGVGLLLSGFGTHVSGTLKKWSLAGAGVIAAVIMMGISFMYQGTTVCSDSILQESREGQKTKSQPDSTSTSKLTGEARVEFTVGSAKNSPSELAPSMLPSSAMRPLPEPVPNSPGKPESSSPLDPVKNSPSELAPSMSPLSAMRPLPESTPNPPREEESSRPQPQAPSPEPEKGHRCRVASDPQ